MKSTSTSTPFGAAVAVETVELEAVPNHIHGWVIRRAQSVSYECPMSVDDAIESYGVIAVVAALRDASSVRTDRLRDLRAELCELNGIILDVEDRCDV